MNAVFVICVLCSIISLLFSSPDAVLSTSLSGVRNALSLSIKMLPTYVVWAGILRISDDSGLSTLVGKKLRRPVSILFKGESEETLSAITMNLAFNFLGMGGAATPLGVKAITLMDKGDKKPTLNQQIFTVLNTTSLDLIPTTVISMRSAIGSLAPSNVILPCLLSSSVATLVGVAIIRIFS